MAGSTPEIRYYQVVAPTDDREGGASNLPALALYEPDGTPHVPLTAVMPNQAVFAGADVTAIKVELNALRTKLINAGLMAAS